MRNVPLLQRHYAKTQQPPACMSLGFAAFILFMKGRQKDSGSYEGEFNGKNYIIQDDNAAKFAEKWNHADTDQVVDAVLADKNLWGVDLSGLPGFAEAVKTNLKCLLENGVVQTLEQLQIKKAYV